MTTSTSAFRLLAITVAAAAILVTCGDDRDVAGSDRADDSTAAETSTLSAADVVDELRAAGLPIGEVVVYDEASDPNGFLGRPGQYTAKAAFRDTRIEGDPSVEGGGDVETFDDAEAQESRADYLASFADEPPLGGWYQYEAGSAILRVSFELTPDQATDYEAAFMELFEGGE